MFNVVWKLELISFRNAVVIPQGARENGCGVVLISPHCGERSKCHRSCDLLNCVLHLCPSRAQDLSSSGRLARVCGLIPLAERLLLAELHWVRIIYRDRDSDDHSI
jgi:hypothetical protein